MPLSVLRSSQHRHDIAGVALAGMTYLDSRRLTLDFRRPRKQVAGKERQEAHGRTIAVGSSHSADGARHNGQGLMEGCNHSWARAGPTPCRESYLIRLGS
jgi:hypothetical protein